MAVHHLVLLQIILLLWPIKTSELLCPDSCGNVSIWYPFGIGERCYFNKWFEVTCVNSSGSTKAFLTAINNLELSEVLFYSSFTVGITVPVISLNGTNYTKAQGLDLSGSPFSFSNAYNRFAVIGCNNYFRIHVSMSDSTIGGCLSICTCNSNRHRGCYDFICPIPRSLGQKLYNTNLSAFLECKSTFMVDQQWLESNYLTNTSSLGQDILKDREYVPARLEWGMRKGRCVELFNSSTSCNPDGYCLIQLSLGHFCLCDGPSSDNYLGCTGDLICNTSSGYNCSQCPDGYYSYKYDYDQETRCYSKIINRILIKKSRLKFIMIIASSAGIGLLLLLIGAWWLYKFIKRRKAIRLKQKFFKRNGGLLLQQHMSSNEGNIVKTKLFTSKELEKATDNYNTNRILGQGGQGTVYKGMLAEGRIVAIKKSKIVDESKVEEFINEVVILSRIDHRNVVQLLGCCLETEVPLLVYEFISNGTLFQHIHDQIDEFPITWELRLRIAIEVVGALSYLHSAASMPIYHRDIKSTNILLDEKYRAKVSDFGTSRSIAVDQTHLTTQVHGTFGYLDPEYFRSSQFTEKSDVYSFGVVLAELLTGQKPIRSTNSEEDKSLAAYFLKAMKENRLFEVLDARVLKEGRKKEIMIVANLTRQCLNLNGKKRPTMRELAIELAGIRVSYNASILQQKCEEIDYVDGNTACQFETSSSFTGSMFDSVSFSIDTYPLILNK